MKPAVSNMISRSFAILALAAIVMAGAACKSAPKAPEADASAGADANLMGDSDSGKAMGLQTVYFPYDSFVLDTTARAVLKSNIDILKSNPALKIQVEGHCDERGGIQYNIALGDKRAGSVIKYITDQGIAGDRVTTISYGKERPLVKGDTEEAYSRNRRANFVVTAR